MSSAYRSWLKESNPSVLSGDVRVLHALVLDQFGVHLEYFVVGYLIQPCGWTEYIAVAEAPLKWILLECTSGLARTQLMGSRFGGTCVGSNDTGRCCLYLSIKAML